MDQKSPSRFSSLALPNSIAASDSHYISKIEYTPPNVTVHLSESVVGTIAIVKFFGVIGFRVLDEGDMLEYWPDCSTPNGWLFQVMHGGWYELESTRSGFLVPHMSPDAKEYIITGSSDCICVLADLPPEIQNLKT